MVGYAVWFINSSIADEKPNLKIFKWILQRPIYSVMTQHTFLCITEKKQKSGSSPTSSPFPTMTLATRTDAPYNNYNFSTKLLFLQTLSRSSRPY